MSFTEAVKSVFSKYAEFSGRARRSEYWFFYLFLIITQVGFTLMAAIDAFTGFPLFSLVTGLASLALIIPTLSVTVRRLHDTGRSGWHIVWWGVLPVFAALIVIAVSAASAFSNLSDPTAFALTLVGGAGFAILLPLVGQFILFIFLVQDSDAMENQYGLSLK